MSELLSAEKKIEQLDPRIAAQFDKASTQRDKGNLDYTISLCGEWIKKYPHVLEFRKLLRDCQIKQCYPKGDYSSAGKPSLKSLIGQLSYPKKDPLKTISRCEKVLSENPLDLKANEFLARTTEQLGWKQTAIFAWQTLLTNPKRKPEHVVALAELMISEQSPEMVGKLCETFLKIFPGNSSITEVRNRASIQKSLQEVDS